MGSVAEKLCIFLAPGEVYFGAAPVRIQTVLGSCVALTLWHPQRAVGGMCHYMLPGAGAGDTRYAEDAFAWLVDALTRLRARPAEFEVRIVGGGNMFPGLAAGPARDIGGGNAAAARHLARVHGLRVVAEHVGGCGHRRVWFDLADGRVKVHQFPIACVNAAP